MNNFLRLILAVFEGFVLGSYMELGMASKSKKSMLWMTGGSIVIMLISSYFLKSLPYKIIVINAGVILLGKTVYKCEWSKIIIRVLLYYGMLMAIETGVLSLLVQVVGISVEEMQQFKAIDYTLIGYLCASVIFILTRTLGKNQMMKCKIAWGYWTIIVLSNVCTIMLIFGIMSFYQDKYVLSPDLTIIISACIGLAVLNVFHYYTYMALREQYEKENEYALIKHANEGQVKYIMQNEKSFGVVRKVKHDLNNQMLGLDYLLERQRIAEAREYIHKISQTLNQVEMKFVTGFSILDNILNQKNQICKLYDIDLQCHINKMQSVGWRAEDICVLMGNALDNAIEAAKEVEISQRKIHIEMYHNKGFNICKIRNAYLATENQKNLRTKKDEKWHGIGVKSIQEIVKKYNGMIHIEKDEQTFTLKIMIPTNVQ